MHTLPIAAVALAAAGFLSPAGAVAPEPGRYQMSPAEGGFLRLDRDTGATAFCRPAGEGYACRPVAEEGRPSPDATAAIEKRLKAVEEALKTAGSAAATKPAEDPTLDLPSDEQMNRVTSFLERAVKRLKQFAETMQKESEAEAPGDRQRL